MAEFPALPFWTDAYLADTRHLTTKEHGAYLLLMMEAWRRPKCDLPDDDALLARLVLLSLKDWMEVKTIIMPFWRLDGRSKTWSQKRLKKERMYVADVSKKRKEASAKRWDKTKKTDANANQKDSTHTHTHTQLKEEPKGSSKKRGSRVSEDWVLPRAWGSWAVEQGMDELGVRREADRFADYWRGVPGQRGVKIDWLATWRNWVRKAMDDRKQSSSRSRPNDGDTRTAPDGTLQTYSAFDGWKVTHV